MVKSLFYSVTFHSIMILLTVLSLPFMLREPIDLPPIVSVELIQISDRTNIPYAPKARKILEDTKKMEALLQLRSQFERAREDIKERFEGYVTGQVKVGGITINLADTRVERMLIDGNDGAITRDQITGGNWMYPAMPQPSILLIDSDDDGMFDEVFHPAANKGKIKTPIIVDWEQSNRSKGFRRELIYQGRDGNNLKLFFREFTDDFRRPAYDQEVQYDLSESELVQFKGLTISVEEANNEYLVYTIEGGSL